MKPIQYYELVLGKVYIIKKDGIVYKGTLHYLKYHDEKDPLTFIDTSTKKMMDFMPSDEYFMES
jgi:hypothetical protein